MFQFQVLDSVISDVHPGDVIFQPILYQRLFTGSLSVQTCGFTPGASYIDKYLSVLQPCKYSVVKSAQIDQITHYFRDSRHLVTRRYNCQIILLPF